jgi:hypothetical protein
MGVQYQPINQISFSIYGQLPLILESGSENTIWVRESYSSWTLGVLYRMK